MRKILFTALGLVTGCVLFAQEDSLTGKKLDEVTVVTGQYKPQSLKNSVYQVRVINNELIRLSGAVNVQQVLNSQLGFRFSNDNTLGTTDVQLMGMTGRSVKILLDGVPMVDRNDTRESLNQVDINTIERIEIVEGPLSVSYGSDALAGVINIITKKNKDNFSVTARAQEETAGNEYHPFSYKGVHNQNIGIDWQQKGWSFAAGGSHNDFDGFGGDQYGRDKKWKPKEQWLGNIKVGYGNKDFNVYYRVDGLNETIKSRGRIGQTYTAIDQKYITDRFIHQVQGEWRIRERMQLSTILSYTDYERHTRTTQHDFIKNTDALTTGAGEQDTAKFNSFIFRTLLQYKLSDVVSLQPGIEINREAATGQRIAGKPVITDYSFFISSEIKPTDKINIRPGLRFIKNSVYDAPPVIPSINTKVRLNKELDLRLAYAYGFRSPALRELYFDFHDANHNIVGNPDLKAEHSNSFNGSLSWSPESKNNLRFTSVLGGFYNQFKNLINYAVNSANTSQFITVNIDKFKTTGVTFENTAACKNLQATIGFSYIGRYNDLSGNETFKNQDLPQFVWSPEFNSNIIYSFPKISASIGLFYKYTGKRPGYQIITNNSTGIDEVHLTEISSFNWADLTFSKTVCRYLTVNGGVKNVFDVDDLASSSTDPGGTHNSNGSIAMAYGRSYFLGLNFKWTKK